jgi:hypothetical protein
VLDGSAGNVTMTASNGGAVLIGGPGDTLVAGKGADTFVFLGSAFGQNKIENYTSSDIIELSKAEFANVAAVQAATMR